MKDKVIVITGANAGRGISRLVSELTEDDLDEMTRVDVKSALDGMQVALEHFKTRGRGHIVNVSSLLGRVPPGAADVTAVIADVIERPRADVYTRPGAQRMIADYYAAEDMAVAEAGFRHG